MWGTLDRLRSNWDLHATQDPLWAVYTDPEKKGRRWALEAFFETGRREIAELIGYIDSLQPGPSRGRALDFGCGVGRLTRALADHFDEVYGVDISAEMIRLAREYNAHLSNCAFVRIRNPEFHDLAAVDFDVIYSNATLQHMPPRYARRYLRALAARLRPGGLLIFQLAARSRMKPTERVRSVLYEQIYRRYFRPSGPAMDMYGIARPQVIAWIEKCGCETVDVTENQVAGPEWTSFRYAAVRRPAQELGI